MKLTVVISELNIQFIKSMDKSTKLIKNLFDHFKYTYHLPHVILISEI